VHPSSPVAVRRSVRVVRRRTAAATQTLTGRPPPRLVIAPRLLCPIKDLAPRSTRRPLSNHPNGPLSTDEGNRNVYRALKRPDSVPAGVGGGIRISRQMPKVRRGDLQGVGCCGREDSPLGAPRRTPRQQPDVLGPSACEPSGRTSTRTRGHQIRTRDLSAPSPQGSAGGAPADHPHYPATKKPLCPKGHSGKELQVAVSTSDSRCR
jgi:hypothetical protein